MFGGILMNNKVEIGAKILTVAFLVLSIVALVLSAQRASGSWLVSIGMASIMLVLRIAIALWLYIRANKETKYPWMWCLLGLVFGLVAVGVYFLIDIYKKVSSIQENIEKT
jgi:hypothetical protein